MSAMLSHEQCLDVAQPLTYAAVTWRAYHNKFVGVLLSVGVVGVLLSVGYTVRG